MAKNFMAPPGGPQVTTFQRPRPSKPKITTPPKRSRPSPSPKVVTEQPIPKDFRRPPQVAPQAPYNRPVPTAPTVDPYIPAQPESRRMPPPGPPMDLPPDRRMRPPGPPMDLPPDKRIRSTPVSPRQLPPRENPVRTTPFAQRPFNPFAPVTPSRPVFPTNPIVPNYPESTVTANTFIRDRRTNPFPAHQSFVDFRGVAQDPRFADHRGSLQHLLNRGLSGGVGQYYE